ncbi:type II secretion system F family protein [Actinomyces vulturis]|uniref:type II secretion system F family protein n=1 Tax=Actinomyces vulturis TaxID=1857645 RepID=UPI001FE04BA6|nr:type II secretion system F family protein [Actinomyces vulturis]
MGLSLVLLWNVWCSRQPTLHSRIRPYIHHRPPTSRLLQGNREQTTVTGALIHCIHWATRAMNQLGSTSDAVARRLALLHTRMSVDEFRIHQLLWALGALVSTLGMGLFLAWIRPVNVVALVVLALMSSIGAIAASDWWLSRRVRQRTAQLDHELPDVVELLALAVGAGQSPLSAIERVATIGQGAFIDDLRSVVVDTRSGTILTQAMERMASRSESAAVGRFCEAMVIALERGTPLADVLRAQAIDAREAARRELMEEGGKKEIAQMIPVVFLVLPVTVIFALFPGLMVLRIGL